MGGLIKEIKEASQLLPEWIVKHTKRDANQVAHELAKLASRWKQCKVMHFRVPPNVHALVDKEVPLSLNDVTPCNPIPP
jgi:hypothetical protein